MVLIGVTVHAAEFLSVEQTAAGAPVRARQGLADRHEQGSARCTRSTSPAGRAGSRTPGAPCVACAVAPRGRPVARPGRGGVVERQLLRLGASVAYYALSAIAPILLIAIAVAGAVFGDEAVRGEIVG